MLGPPGSGQLVGATEYGGPGDPSSGSFGSSGANLLDAPDSYAELGGTTFQTATAMGGLPYLTPLRITWGDRSAIAYKRDIGLGGGPIDGLPRVLDLWWQFAGGSGSPTRTDCGRARCRSRARPTPAPATCSDRAGASPSGLIQPSAAAQDPGACAPQTVEGVPMTSGEHAQLLSNGLAAAPAGAPPAVAQIIAAGNQIAGKPYEVGGGHGLPLAEIGSTYDCSSSVEHLLYGARLLPVTYDAAVGDARVVRAARPRPLGHALRQSRPRVHVRGRAALGHAQRRRPGRRQHRDRLASADPQLRRIRRPPPGGTVTRCVGLP